MNEKIIIFMLFSKCQRVVRAGHKAAFLHIFGKGGKPLNAERSWILDLFLSSVFILLGEILKDNFCAKGNYYRIIIFSGLNLQIGETLNC